MLKLLDQYKGVIFFLFVIVVMFCFYSSGIKQFDEQQKQNQIAYYEK